MAGRTGGAQQLRIIGGAWRGRRWRFPASPAIRPTPDRVRETLFNWLGQGLHGVRCLDLFAGSGALGLEALSRGAQSVVFVERDAASVAALRALLAEWPLPDLPPEPAQGGAASAPPRAQVIRADALRWIDAPRPADWPPFDVVFLDPPFGDEVLGRCCAALEQHDWLADGARIYVECPSRTAPPRLPPGWSWRRSGTAGEVGYHLAERGDRGVRDADSR
jgi:16S rRNA (guanine966-N2)-methyltransferase